MNRGTLEPPWLALLILLLAPAATGNQPTWDIHTAPKPCGHSTTTHPCGFRLLKRRESAHARVYLATNDFGTYNHAVMIDYCDDFFLLSWKNAPQDEEQPGQRVLYSTSDDGLAWSPTDGRNILFPNMSTTAHPAHLFAEPSVILRGRRYATASFSQFSVHPAPNPGAVLMRRVYPDKSLGSIFWATSEPWEQFLEGAASAGVKLLHDMDDQTQSDVRLLWDKTYLPCGKNHTLKCEAVVGEPLPGHESGFWQVPNSKQQVVMFRHHGARHPFQWSARDTPFSHWSEIGDSNFPDVGSNLNAGHLPSQLIYVLSNACPKSGGPPQRDPLVVSLSADGFSFTRSLAIATCHHHLDACSPRFPGLHKNTGPSYPQGVTVVGKGGLDGLYVAFSNNKEDIWVSKIQYSALALEDDSDEEGQHADQGDPTELHDGDVSAHRRQPLMESLACHARGLIMWGMGFFRWGDLTPEATAFAGCCARAMDTL